MANESTTSLVSSFGFSNTTAATKKAISLYDLGLTQNYALTHDEPTECRLVNTTAPLDREEYISFRCKDIAKVNTTLGLVHPAPTKAGVQYQVQLEAVLTSVDAASNFQVDEPIVVQLSVRHPKSGRFSAETVQTAVERTVSALFTDTDGAPRIKELMRSALKPTKD